MIDANDQKQIQLMIDASLKKAMDFQTRKRGDTPTDDLQLTPKKYVDSKVGVGGATKAIQYNNAGVLGGDNNFQWDTALQTLSINDGGGDLFEIFPNGADNFSIGTSGANGNITIQPSKALQLFSTTGDVYTGAGTALQTTATAGFLRIPRCAGTPTGTPTVNDGATLPIVYDTTNNKLYVYISGTGWKSVLLS